MATLIDLEQDASLALLLNSWNMFVPWAVTVSLLFKDSVLVLVCGEELCMKISTSQRHTDAVLCLCCLDISTLVSTCSGNGSQKRIVVQATFYLEISLVVIKITTGVRVDLSVARGSNRQLLVKVH